jgi:hypothetical protein
MRRCWTAAGKALGFATQPRYFCLGVPCLVHVPRNSIRTFGPQLEPHHFRLGAFCTLKNANIAPLHPRFRIAPALGFELGKPRHFRLGAFGALQQFSVGIASLDNECAVVLYDFGRIALSRVPHDCNDMVPVHGANLIAYSLPRQTHGFSLVASMAA